MKNISAIFFLFFTSLLSSAQPGEWVWLHGDSTANSTGNYGIQGVSSPTNMPPGIYEACDWKDNQGNLWIWGGHLTGGNTNSDLWKYDIVLNEWTWMKGPGTPNDPGNYGTQGVSAPSNLPPYRQFGNASWTDLSGDLWMFGGYDYSDLWRYQISTNEWTWMKGPVTQGVVGIYGIQGVPDPANNPGSRCETAVTWVDVSGDLWLFGGYAGFSDLWKYNIASNQWAWMKGPQTTLDPGVYGTRGVEDPLNNPPGRMTYSSWREANGNLWLYGGFDNVTNFYNDVWRFKPSTNSWTWMQGSNLPNMPGLHGTRCEADSMNTPDLRFETRATVEDQYGMFWMFGGGSPATFTDAFNDLWVYCTRTNNWIWVGGDSIPNPVGHWGVKGVSDPANRPDGRGGAVSINPGNGAFYFFGGTGTGFGNFHNDIWKYTVDYNCVDCPVQPIALFTAPHHICPGTCTQFNNNSSFADSYEWIFPGATPSTSTEEEPDSICYYTPGQYAVTIIASNQFGSDTLTLPNYITVYPFSPPQTIQQIGDTLFANPGFVQYQWFYNGDTIPGATSTWYLAPQSGDYSMICIDNNGCIVEVVVLNVIASIAEQISENDFYVYPNPASDQIEIKIPEGTKGPALKNVQAEITNSIGEKFRTVWMRESGTENLKLDVSFLRSGLYFLELRDGSQLLRSTFLKK